MARTDGRIDTCAGCDQITEIAARGLCWTCYARASRARRHAWRFPEFIVGVCGKCWTELKHVCWICESRPALQGESACRPCKTAGDALAKYWREKGMPVAWKDGGRKSYSILPHRERIGARA